MVDLTTVALRFLCLHGPLALLVFTFLETLMLFPLLPSEVVVTAAGTLLINDPMSFQGNPAPTIVEYAERYEHDLIVMPTHGREGVSRYLIGSVSEKIVRLSPGLFSQPGCNLTIRYLSAYIYCYAVLTEFLGV